MIEIAPEASRKLPRTMAEAAFYNQGIADFIEIADRSAQAIAAVGRRPLAEGFAVAALEELARVGRALLVYYDPLEGRDTVSLPERLPALSADMMAGLP